MGNDSSSRTRTANLRERNGKQQQHAHRQRQEEETQEGSESRGSSSRSCCGNGRIQEQKELPKHRQMTPDLCETAPHKKKKKKKTPTIDLETEPDVPNGEINDQPEPEEYAVPVTKRTKRKRKARTLDSCSTDLLPEEEDVVDTRHSSPLPLPSVLSAAHSAAHSAHAHSQGSGRVFVERHRRFPAGSRDSSILMEDYMDLDRLDHRDVALRVRRADPGSRTVHNHRKWLKVVF
ncbi:hypothetical protein WMY93_002013 [Mugilogobius chulae]|uniref:Uncharacterized protein n=1 Tax=Mugilogobius chulae TaxID=88201 RepID=A0AAW0PVY8_9GOBI